MAEETKAIRSFIVEISEDGTSFNTKSIGTEEMSSEEIYSTIEFIAEGIKEHREARKMEVAVMRGVQKVLAQLQQARTQEAPAADTEEK